MVPAIILFFFFQAEDGIRDRTVTGVQTCALPISYHLPPFTPSPSLEKTAINYGLKGVDGLNDRPGRSEERRVGKECRSMWWPCHGKEINTSPTGCTCETDIHQHGVSVRNQCGIAS